VTRGLAVTLTAGVGGLIALQAPINSLLGHRVGTLGSATISFVVGTIALTALLVIGGGAGRLHAVKGAPWYYFAGGLLGMAYVTCVLVTVRSLGAGGVTAATIAGQLTMAVVIDALGWLGVAKHPITAARVAGIVLLAVGTFLVVRE
jgi:transporter family-2 protein